MDIRNALQAATRESHQALDQHPVIVGLVRGDLSPGTYTALLAEYHGWFQGWETSVRQIHPDVVDELGAFRFGKSDWLASDLSRLGQPPASARSDVRAPAEVAGLAGALYVIEGSTLGGAALVRAGAGFPAGADRFYRGYGERTGPAWREMVEWLERTVDHARLDLARHQAARVFAEFHAMVNRAAAGVAKRETAV
ncbi:biliverdin-producing heme oxygenase [Haloferula sargassicola]|uniref:Heme oxygenase n=1 Tax=Haloferula sargassicola TaxID=490096 RepID=A0ABP9UIK9_9BACT